MASGWQWTHKDQYALQQEKYIDSHSLKMDYRHLIDKYIKEKFRKNTFDGEHFD
jgi:hypothetical protein